MLRSRARASEPPIPNEGLDPMKPVASLIIAWLAVAPAFTFARQTKPDVIEVFRAWKLDGARAPTAAEVANLNEYLAEHPNDGEAKFFLAGAISGRLAGT